MKNNLSFKICLESILGRVWRGFRNCFILLFCLFCVQATNGQVRKLILKINDPVPVCYPASVDLTSSAITAGSTEGLVYHYYSDQEMLVSIVDPTNVGAGIYYIKGVLSGINPSFVAAAIHVTVNNSPKLIVVNPVHIAGNELYDLTSTSVTLGSDAQLTYSYWMNKELSVPVKRPESVDKGTYFIKGTSVNGCYDRQQIDVE